MRGAFERCASPHLSPCLRGEVGLRSSPGEGLAAYSEFVVRRSPPTRAPQKRGEGALRSRGDSEMTAPPLLDVNDLTVEFATRRGIVRAVQHVNISVGKGETLGIVGESGPGNSVTSYAATRILDRAGQIRQGTAACSGIGARSATEAQ